MKFSRNWLNDFLKRVPAADDLAEKLTLAGLEVDAVTPVAGSFDKVVVGQVRSLKPHPDADRLKICQVEVADKKVLQIVCGANNVYAGMKAPVALVGALLPDNIKIRKSKLRGEDSYGMLCSDKELGIAEQAEGLMDLPKDAPVGQSIRDYLELDDVTIEVDLTPNRADCLSVYGMAREIAALSEAQLKSYSLVKIAPQDQDSKKIINHAEVACPIYYGRVIHGINSRAKTPLWMKERLRRSGLRAISVIVDITNYVLLELGQPMHAFDADRLGNEIHIRFANDGEKLCLLDESEVNLKENTLVIADEKKAQAMAGIIGGLESSVSDQTESIFLESAFFAPKNIAGRARSYGLHTDSSHRYERGVDPKLSEKAIEYATKLILEIAGGVPGPVVSSVFPIEKSKPISLHLAKINRVLGVELTSDFVEEILTRLNFAFEKKTEHKWQVSAPSYRFDMYVEEDLIEEVARLYGYQNIPFHLPKLQAKNAEIPEGRIASMRLKSLLADRGFCETINYSFIDTELDALFFEKSGVVLKNPISKEMAVMRQSLIPGLLLSFKANLNRQQSRIRLFEEGSCFYHQLGGEFLEIAKLAGIAFGSHLPPNWQVKPYLDFYRVKADVEALLKLNRQDYRFEVCEDVPWLHPGQAARICQGEDEVGLIGVLHPNIMKALQIKVIAPIIFELELDRLCLKAASQFEAFSKFPAVTRDLALVVAKALPVQALMDVIKALDIAILNKVDIFDVYQGESIGTENKSIALSLSFQDHRTTLTEDQVNAAIAKIVDAVQKRTGAKLRG